METEFKDLEFLTEAVIDKRGFFYHGDQMPPDRFIKAVTEGTYNNTSSMYGTGMYCVRHISDARDNSYGPYIYKLYVRGLDNFLHLDEMPYRSTFNIKGRKDSEDDFYAIGSTSYSGRSKEPYAEFVMSQFRRLANRPIEEEDENFIMQGIASGMKGKKGVKRSAAILYKICSYAVKYGISGVTYTGNHDGRCALVYDFNNVFPVAWAKLDILRRSVVPQVPAKNVDSAWAKKEFSKVDYSKNPQARSFITKWSGEKNVRAPVKKDRYKIYEAAEKIKYRMYRALGNLDSKAFVHLYQLYAGIETARRSYDINYVRFMGDFFKFATYGDSDSLYSLMAKRALAYPLPNNVYYFSRSLRDEFFSAGKDYDSKDEALLSLIEFGVDELRQNHDEAGVFAHWEYPKETYENFFGAIRLMLNVFRGTRGDEFPDKENVMLDKEIVQMCDWCIEAFRAKVGNLSNLGDTFEFEDSKEEEVSKLIVLPIIREYETCIKVLERLKTERGGGAPVHSVENSGV